jgi:hypothetical protein
MTVVKGNTGGSWGASHSTPTPTVRQVPIVDNVIKPQKQQKFTDFTYEDWGIHFQEQEPFAWYIHHNCPEGPSTAHDNENHTIHYVGPNAKHIGIDDKHHRETFPGENELLTNIKCYKCKQAISKYNYLILRRTQKFMLRGKIPFKP